MNRAKLLHRLVNFMPYGIVRLIPGPLSGLAYYLHEHSSHRREIHEAIAAALDFAPEDRKVDELVKANFRHLLSVFLEVTRFDDLSREWTKRVKVEGFEHYEKARATGRGIILFSGHVGNWELLISGLPLLGIDEPYALGWKQPPSEFNDLLDQQRMMWGTRILWAQEFVEAQVAEILTKGGTFYMMSDRFEQGKTKVKLFNQPTGTPAGPVLFARKYGAALIPVHTYREGSTHRIVFEPPVELGSLPADGDLTADLQQCMSIIEGWIKEHPEQWVWIFKRGEWKIPK